MQYVFCALVRERGGGSSGGGRRRRSRVQSRGHAVRFHPAAFVPFHRLALGEQHSAAQRCAAHDMTGYDQFRKGEGSSTTRRDGMEMEMGREQPSFFGSLAWALARQSNLVRLACQRENNNLGLLRPACQPANLARIALRLTAAAAAARAPKRVDLRACLSASSAARLWIDSCEDVNR